MSTNVCCYSSTCISYVLPSVLLSTGTYSIVTEVKGDQLYFVLDKNGAKKRISKRNWIRNIRRLNYAECFYSDTSSVR